MASKSSIVSFTVISLFFICISSVIQLKFDTEQPEPYMDEIFHIPQAQRYCDGRFQEWDPMITTLPGLYLTSVAILKPLSLVIHSANATCSVAYLRSVNVLLAAGNLYVLWRLTETIHQHDSTYTRNRGLISSLTMALFPVLYFFTFLYYTDAGSTIFVLLAYLLELKGHHVLGAIAGACGVMFRQTNVIWVVFIAMSSACDQLLEIIVPNKRSAVVRTDDDDAVLTKVVLKWFYNAVRVDRQALLRVVIVVLPTVWPYLIVAMGFVVFVWINGSIVVGAKQDHGAGFHVPLVFYFVGFTVAFSFVNFITFETVCSFMSFVRRRLSAVLVALFFGFTCVHWFTYAHRYLVADNRHYTFYVWSRIIARSPAVRYLLVPAYVFSAYAVLHTLAARKHLLWRLVFTCCLVLVLVPSTLLEFRYFIVPYLLVRLNIPCPSLRQLVVELGLYVVINALTLYLFLYRPFQWATQSDWQRFMW